ncbi:Protein kinase-like domain containing protein [Amanita muscaria]
MLEVAKAVRYFHSMGIVLHDLVDSDDIFLDSEFHARFRFLGLTAYYVNVTPIWHLGQQWLSHEANIFFFGCLFYEMCFDVKISFGDRNAVSKRPSKPEIRDDVWQLIQRCCAKEPKSRPTMEDVVREMVAWDITY